MKHLLMERRRILFVTCGDPSLDVTEQLVYAMAEAGQILHFKLGILFSDPTAEDHDTGGQCASTSGGVGRRIRSLIWWCGSARIAIIPMVSA